MQVWAIKRPYLYNDQVVALVTKEDTASLLAEKWNCKSVPLPAEKARQIMAILND